MHLPIRNSCLLLPQGHLFWREVGRGVTLVFLHGSWSDSSEWLSVIEQLGGDFHCFAPDLLGFGESDRPPVHYSIELEVECLATFLDTLKLRQIYLVGQGVGGWIAASYALRYPHQIEGLVLLAAEGLPVAGSYVARRRWLARVPLMVWLGRSLTPLARFLGQGDRLRGWLQEARLLKHHPTACQLLFNRRTAEINAEQMGDRLPWLKTPVLILQGDDETGAIAQLNEGYRNAPHATMQHYPGANLVETAPAIVAQAIGSFVQSAKET